jgi:MFS family permease
VFYVTLIIYLAGVLLSAVAWDFWSLGLFRLLTGLGIGGEYAAVNSAIDELIPAKYRGRVDLIVNGSFWLGAALGALAAPVLLDQKIFTANLGWRLGFGIGGILGTVILLLRSFVPQKPKVAGDALPQRRRRSYRQANREPDIRGYRALPEHAQ